MLGVNRALANIVKLLSVLLLLTQAACSQANQPMVLPVDATPMTVMTGGAQISINVEIARTEEQRARGLMFRERLPDGRGMLFVFDEPDLLAFWMENTPEPLDIIYIAGDGKIVSMHKGEPLSRDSIPSGGAAQFVLELAYGEAARLGLRIGDILVHPEISNKAK